MDESDEDYEYYLSVKPTTVKTKAILVLLPGFGQKAEDVFLDTKFHKYASENEILTIAFSGRTKLTADEFLQEKINNVFQHILSENDVEDAVIILGGFSTGGVIALRYAELCQQYPDRFPVQIRAVFMADSPVDLFQFVEIKRAKSEKRAVCQKVLYPFEYSK